MARTEPASPSPPTRSEGPLHRVRALVGRLGDSFTLAFHRLADRFDLVPPEFGRETPVDESHARSVRMEWIRLLRLWAAHNPEEIFALKVGGGLLAAAVAALWLAIALIL